MPRSGDSRSIYAILAACASMRPGQSCPGVVRSGAQSRQEARHRFNEAGAIMPRSGRRAGHDAFQLQSASMRPGQSCPGVVHRRSDDGNRDPAGFNEAGAIMPRSGLIQELAHALEDVLQ